MATNPLGIFSAALANGPHTEPVDVGQMLRTAALQGAQTQGLQAEAQEAQARTQGIGLQNQQRQIDLQLEQQRRAAAQEFAKQVPSSPPPSGFPAAPANPNDPNYHAAMASASNPVPTFDWNGYAVKLLSMGDLEGGITALKTHQEFQKSSLANAKSSLENLDAQNTSRGKYAASVMKLMQEKGPDAAAALWQAVGPQMESEGLIPKGAGSQPFDPQKVDALYKQAVGADDPIQKAKNAINEQVASVGKTQAEADEAKARTKLYGTQAETAQIDLEWIKNQGAMTATQSPADMGKVVDTIVDSKKGQFYSDLNARTKSEIAAVMSTVEPTKRREAVANVLTKAAQTVTEQESTIAKETNPTVLAARRNNAIAEARALREGDNPALAGVPPAAAQGAVTQATKLDTDYSKAREATEAMGKILDLADKGNVAAGANIPMVGVGAANAINGIKRINSAEISQYGTAGSLLQKIQGKLQGWTEGQPIPASVRDDIRELHQQLGEQAYRQYTTGLDSLNKRTGAKFGPTIDPPNIRRAGTSAVPPAVQAVLKGAGPGVHTLSDGTKWLKASDGTITQQ